MKDWTFNRRDLLKGFGAAGLLGLLPMAAMSSMPARLVVTAIPDDGDSARMREHFGTLAHHLGQAVNTDVEYVHVQNYAASVTALATGRAHVAWLGAVTTAQAWQMMGDDLVVLGCRDIDKEFVSYFVGHPDSGVRPVTDLSELAAQAEGQRWRFTFGSRSSTSSHLMPRKFFTDQAGRRPEDVFHRVAYSGSHDVVMRMVGQGSFAVGAMNYSTWDNASAELQEAAPIIYRTPKFTNYALVARRDLGDTLLGDLRSALLNLDRNSDPSRQLLDYLSAERFISAELDEWSDYVELLESGVDIGG